MTQAAGRVDEVELQKIRRKLLEAFPDRDRLWVWRSHSWRSDLHALYQELEQLLELPLGKREAVLTEKAIVILARSDSANCVMKALIRLATLGLKSRIGGERSHQENKTSLQRRDCALLERAREKLKHNSHLSLSKLAVSLSAKPIADEFIAEGLRQPGSARSIRRTLLSSGG